jgi:8-oxo-dGTP diphosphatase
VGCPACGYQLFVNPRPTGGVVLLDGSTFLALKRAREPRSGFWDLPGGFCDGFESPLDAAIREAREELGVEVSVGQFVGMYVGTYLFQDEVLPILDCYWIAAIAAGEIELDRAEAHEYAWLSLENPPAEMAFDTQERALADAWAAVSGHVRSTA